MELNLSGFACHSSDHHCWLFPAQLFGAKSKVNAFSKCICKKAISGSPWESILNGLPCISVLNDESDIFISDRTKFYRSDSKLWRLNSLLITLDDLVLPPNDGLIFHNLKQQMLNTLWGCITLLDFHNCVLRSNYNIIDEKNMAYLVLKSQVFWLPEILFLSGRIANTTTPEMAKNFSDMPHFKYQWASAIFNSAKILGYPISFPGEDNDSSYAEECFPDWDLVEEMKKSGLIKEHNCRYELSFSL